MTFEKLSSKWESQLRSLWETVFGDEREYIDLFFDNCYKHAEAMGAVENGEVLSMLFLLPMSVHSKTENFDAAYIYAVATAPEHRGKGISTRLLEETHKYLEEKGLALSVLVPASDSLFNYYFQRGFRTEFYLDFIDWEYRGSKENIDLFESRLDALKDIRDRFFSDSGMYCSYDEQQLAYREKEIRFLNGKTLAFSLGCRQGYAVCLPIGDEVLIKEFCFEYDESVFDAIAEYFKVNKLKIRMRGSASPFAMSYWYADKPCFEDRESYISLVLD